MYYNFYTDCPIPIAGDDMKDRKQQVVNKAHQLFIDKGFQATSIQDILDYSGISKGTFYNYFSSKNELLIAIFTNVFKIVEQGRNELLIGQDASDIDIFIKQIEFQLETNHSNKLFSLFEEVHFSNDEDLKQFIKRGNFQSLHWLYGRFIDLFGENKKPYLLDCAIMFMGILQHTLKYSHFAYESDMNLNEIVRYCVKRIVKIVDDVTEADDQLIHPDFMDSWLPKCKNTDQSLQEKLYHIVLTFKKSLCQPDQQDLTKFTELLDFVQDELLKSNNPRKFLIESALLSLKTEQTVFKGKELQQLDEVVAQILEKNAE